MESELERVSLGHNRLTGPMPNDLSGTIPSSLGDLTNLESLYLFRNDLRGQIPSSMGNLKSLNCLYISENGLTGCIPAGLRDVPNHDLDNIGLDYCARQSTGDGVARDDSIEVKRYCLTSGGSRRSCAAMLRRPFPGTNWTA